VASMDAEATPGKPKQTSILQFVTPAKAGAVGLRPRNAKEEVGPAAALKSLSAKKKEEDVVADGDDSEEKRTPNVDEAKSGPHPDFFSPPYARPTRGQKFSVARMLEETAGQQAKPLRPPAKKGKRLRLATSGRSQPTLEETGDSPAPSVLTVVWATFSSYPAWPAIVW
jgi:hypothetical protein